MRKFRLSRLVLAATVIGVVGLFSLPIIGSGTAFDETTAENQSAISQVDWTNADETYPVPSGSPTPSPSYDGDGTSDTDGEDGPGTDPSGGASPESGPRDSGDDKSGGILGLAFPVQAGMSVGLLALAFLALLPGRKMPADLH